MTAEPLDKREWFITQALNDTGFFCRRVLGNTYDLKATKDASGLVKTERVNENTGGVRRDGPHKLMTEFLDNNTGRGKILLAPRGSYKSTILVGYCMRRLIKERQLRCFYGMHVFDEAKTKLNTIKATFENNVHIRHFWGDMRGKPWRQEGFNIAGWDPTAQSMSFEAFGVDKPKTGGHANIIVCDDLVQHKNIRTPDGIQKTKDVFKMLSPILVNGGIIIDCGTLYCNNDLHSWLIEEKGDSYDVLSLDAGVEVERNDKGKLYIIGTPRFAHLDKERLEAELARMDYADFCSQYLNRITSGLHQTFERHHFRPIALRDETMRPLTGYCFVDTAVTAKEESCFSVVAYGLFDRADNFYLADCRIGKWPVDEITRQFIAVLEAWTPRCYHKGELLEVTDANYVFKEAFRVAADNANLRLNLIMPRRAGSDDDKERRIKGLGHRFRNGKFYVLSTCPRTFHDLTGERLLFDPEGYWDEKSRSAQPAGFLVDCFTGFPRTNQRDIPDALADMDREDDQGYRYARYCTPETFIQGLQARPIASQIPVRGSRIALQPRIDQPRRSWAERVLGRRGLA